MLEKRPLGNSNLSLTVLGIGTWAIGGSGWAYGWGAQRDSDSIQAIHSALDLGINWIDTAPIYGLGHAEEIAGKALQGRPDVIIATKCGLSWDSQKSVFGCLRPKNLRKELESSLKRLKRECIDLYQIHWPDPAGEIEDAWSTLSKFVEEGKVRTIGVSNFSVKQMTHIASMAPITSLQPPYNILRPEIERDILPYCQKHHIGVVTYSPMQCGLLTGTWTHKRIHQLPDTDWRKTKNPSFQEPELGANLQLVESLKGIAEEENLTLAQLAIAWVLRNKVLTSTIVGMRSKEQAENILSLQSWELNMNAFQAIETGIAQRIQTLKLSKAQKPQ